MDFKTRLNYRNRFLLVLVSFFLLTGFNVGDQIMTILEIYNSRSSANFNAQARNIVQTVPKGTIGEVIAISTLKSGNRGIRIRLNGQQYPHLSARQREVWIYDWKDRTDDIRLCVDSRCTQPTQEPSSATHAQALRETRTYDQPTQSPVISRTEAGSGCNEDCSGSPGSKTSMRSERSEQITILRQTSNRGISKACFHNFMTSKGDYRQWGLKIKDKISEEPYHKTFIRGNAMTDMCPRFRSLTDEQKKKVWTFFWMALAQEESSCKATVTHRTHTNKGRRINPRLGYGLWAMEYYQRDRAFRGRPCSDRSISSVEAQIACSVDIMHDTQLRKGRGLYTKKSYWGPVRRYRKQLRPHMRRVKECWNDL